MSVFGQVGCLLNRHTPLRRDVIWNGMTYVGYCRHCGVAIERLDRHKWRKRLPEEEVKRGAAR